MMSAVITVRIQNETEWRMERIRMSGRLKYLFIYLLGVGGIMRNLPFPSGLSIFIFISPDQIRVWRVLYS